MSSDLFVLMEDAQPTQHIGPEMAIFDGKGVLAASYRTERNSAKIWVYEPRMSNMIMQTLIVSSEQLARMFCLKVAQERGLVVDSNYDIDDMMKGLMTT